ncbi:hypothetical protein V496_05022 [Pseudogymnoascus sp. VKM F-4515 (FW-2607)]|nr:hypothetical protein V496_05022 [Pseudogymnoascus sp. VKM F-4515 (FW-2607)]KFY92808.1 hypothetical protein V498_04740 [Pseudogymnoascus sp. VKM F-4517 (FW-2822)]
MARLMPSQSPAPTYSEDVWDASPKPTPRRTANRAPRDTSPSSSPHSAASLSSDKENKAARSRAHKGKGREVMGAVPVSRGLSEISNGRNVKRKATEVRDTGDRSRSVRRRTREPENGSPVSQNGDEEGFDNNYDPDQDLQERRELRARFRTLEKDLNNNRAEFLRADNEGLKQTLLDADEILDGVKQTGDATVDSRLIANAADLSLKKIEKLTLGDSDRRVDIDHFVAKCMTFMRQGRGHGSAPTPSARAPTSTQSRRRTMQNGDNPDDDDDPEAGDMLDWSHLGAFACQQHNSRPPIPGFLLGPLSLEKRARRVIQRRAPNANRDLVETQPEILRPEDIERSENSSLTFLCARIMERLRHAAAAGMDACEAEAWEGITDEEVKMLMRKHGLNADGGMDLFRFVINPRSFGQTVENMFYVSFLIRDGKAAITVDEDGLPFLGEAEPLRRTESVKKDVSKHQAIFAIDMATWEELIEVFEIREPIIEHREEVVQRAVGARGWYS